MICGSHLLLVRKERRVVTEKLLTKVLNCKLLKDLKKIFLYTRYTEALPTSLTVLQTLMKSICLTYKIPTHQPYLNESTPYDMLSKDYTQSFDYEKRYHKEKRKTFL